MHEYVKHNEYTDYNNESSVTQTSYLMQIMHVITQACTRDDRQK